ncbi:hypothetical protein LJC55_00905 [Eubacteriales bacterium OttesenSCG-928-N14]|nr:hypothetical protein [Eubacteriales bacterium OttesenSCG-928-N14]
MTVVLLIIVAASAVSAALYFNSYGRMATASREADKYFANQAKEHRQRVEQA